MDTGFTPIGTFDSVNNNIYCFFFNVFFSKIQKNNIYIYIYIYI
mgnify:CR=1 FL=1